jgi:hypothetical protein
MISLLFAFSAQAAIVRGITWTASSTSPETDGIPSTLTALADNKQATSWIEGEEGAGLGSHIKTDFTAEKTITSINLWAGCWYNSAYWKHFARPKQVQVEFSDGTTQDFNLTDSFTPQSLVLSAPKKTTSIKIKIKAVYTGDVYQDTAISEVQILDTSPEERIGGTVRASSTYPADGDGNYEAKNVVDGISDAAWCEGDKGDGTGQWLEITFPGTVTVSQLKLRNGVTYSADAYKKANAATAATITFSDGSVETIKISDVPFEQAIKFTAPHTASSAKITFTTVRKGTEFNDLCVSEIYFLK